MRIKVIGIGGITQWLLPPLFKFLEYGVKEEVEIVLIDGDSYEEKNQDRQDFDRLGNKAEVTRDRLTPQYERLFIKAESVYASEDNVVALIREGDIVFLGVDNHQTRKLVSDRCEELEKVTLISGGNDYTDGDIHCFIRHNGRNITAPLANLWHPEIQYPQDRHPAERGCDELQASEPQLVITNNAIAAAMLNAFYAYLQNRWDKDEVYVDVLSGNSRAVRRSNEVARANVSEGGCHG